MNAKTKQEAFAEIKQMLEAKLTQTFAEYERLHNEKIERMKEGELVWNYTTNTNNRTSLSNQSKHNSNKTN